MWKTILNVLTCLAAMATLGITVKLLFLAQDGYQVAVRQLKQGQWLSVDPPTVTFGPAKNQVIFKFVVTNLLSEDAKNVVIDGRVDDFDSFTEWRQLHLQTKDPRFKISLLKGGERQPVPLSFGTAPNDPKRYYCGSPYGEKATPFFVRFIAFWKDSENIPYRQFWTFRARCVLGGNSQQPDYEKRKYAFFFYPFPSEWFGGAVNK